MAIRVAFTLLILNANALNHIGERHGTLESLAGMLMGLLGLCRTLSDAGPR